MQEEVTQKTIALSMKTGKLTAQALQAALKKYLQHRAKGPKLHHGKQSLKQLKAHGAALTNIEVTEANIGAFKPCAKKYGVDFTLRKDKTTQPPHYIVIFKAKDADNLEQAFREFTAKTLFFQQVSSGLGDAFTTGGRRKYDTEYMRGVFFMIINSESLRKCCAQGREIGKESDILFAFASVFNDTVI